MVHPGNLGILPDNGQAVLMGFPVMDDNGQMEGLGQLQLAAKDILL